MNKGTKTNINKTQTFVATGISESSINYNDVFRPDRIVYKIDDCMMTQDLEVVDSEKGITNLNKLMNNKLPEYIDVYSDIIDDDVPVLLYTDYLKEIKDLARQNQNKKSFRQLKRMFIEMQGNVVVSCCIVFGLKKNKAIMINEVYQDGNFAYAAQYDLEEVMRNYSSITGKNISNKRIPNPQDSKLNVLR